jgi:predicted MFS family arabinose efflux permease
MPGLLSRQPFPAVQAPHDRLFTRSFVLLGLAELAYFTAEGVAIYALPMYVTGPLGAGTAGAGLAFGAFALSALLLRPLAGRLSDTAGRRPLLIGGALLCAFGMALTAQVDSLALVLALRVVLGVAEAAFFVAAFAALADLAPPSRRGEALSYNSLGLYLGLAFGPPLGEVLVTVWGFAAAWRVAAALAVISALVALRLGETRPDTPPATGSAGLVHRPSLPVAMGFLAATAVMGGYLAFVALHADRVGLANTSLPLLLYGLVVVLCRTVFAKVPDRLPSLPLGAAALVTMAGGLVICAAWQSPAGILAGTVPVAVGVAFSTPAFFSAVFARASASERGAASGTMSAAIDLGVGAGPIMLGIVAEAAGVPWAFGLAAGVAVAGAAWTTRVGRRGAPRPAGP